MAATLLVDAVCATKLPEGATVRMVKPEAKCPKCNQHGYFRSGVNFEHERRCAGCRLCWEPGESYLLVEIP